jgi:hypothetical protein
LTTDSRLRLLSELEAKRELDLARRAEADGSTDRARQRPDVPAAALVYASPG